MLADSSGYCLNFEIYSGKVGYEVEQNFSARVVKNMSSEIANKNHKVVIVIYQCYVCKVPYAK